MEAVVIVGAGLAGLAAALGLHRKGVRSLVLESSPSLRASGFFQQSDSAVVSFLRDRFLSGVLARRLLKMADYDCGTLVN